MFVSLVTGRQKFMLMTYSSTVKETAIRNHDFVAKGPRLPMGFGVGCIHIEKDTRMGSQENIFDNKLQSVASFHPFHNIRL
jgi:hypothetical protein